MNSFAFPSSIFHLQHRAHPRSHIHLQSTLHRKLRNTRVSVHRIRLFQVEKWLFLLTVSFFLRFNRLQTRSRSDRRFRLAVGPIGGAKTSDRRRWRIRIRLRRRRHYVERRRNGLFARQQQRHQRREKGQNQSSPSSRWRGTGERWWRRRRGRIHPRRPHSQRPQYRLRDGDHPGT